MIDCSSWAFFAEKVSLYISESKNMLLLWITQFKSNWRPAFQWDLSLRIQARIKNKKGTLWSSPRSRKFFYGCKKSFNDIFEAKINDNENYFFFETMTIESSKGERTGRGGLAECNASYLKWQFCSNFFWLQKTRSGL